MNKDYTQKKYLYIIIAIYGFYYMAYTSTFSFLVTYLSQFNFSDSQIALIFTGMSIVTLISKPLLGYLADSKIPIKRIVTILMICSIPCAFLIPLSGRSYFMIYLSVLSLAFFDQSLLTLIDSWTYISSSINQNIIYSVARGMGSFTSSLTGLVTGRAMEALGGEIIFVFHTIFMSIALIAAIFFINVPISADTAKSKKISLIKAFTLLFTNKKYMIMVLGFLLLNIGNRANVTYLPVMIEQLGGTASHQGTAIFMLTVGIYPVMLIYPKLLRRFDVSKLLLVGCALIILRIVSMIVVSDLNILIYVQLLEAFAFGFFNPAAIEYASKITPQALRSSAIALSATIQVAFCGIVGNIIASYLLSVSTLKTMYTIYVAVAIIGLLVVFSSIKTKLDPSVEES